MRLTLTLLLLLATAAPALAGRYGATADPEIGDSISVSGSYGLIFDRDADFWGSSISYAHPVTDLWGYSLSLAYDQETENKNDGTRKTVNSLSAIAVLYYMLADDLSISGGFGKGFADDGNDFRSFELSSGDWSTGVALGYTLFARENWQAVLDTSLEYNISQKEWSMSWDLGIGFSF